MPRRGEFRANTDLMLEYIDQLRAAEERKRSVEVGSHEFIAAAEEASELSRLTFRWAQMELEMALAVQAQGDAVAPDVRLINVEPRPLDRVLAHWREAQLRLETARPGSPEADAAVKDIDAFVMNTRLGTMLRAPTPSTSRIRGARTSRRTPESRRHSLRYQAAAPAPVNFLIVRTRWRPFLVRTPVLVRSPGRDWR